MYKLYLGSNFNISPPTSFIHSVQSFTHSVIVQIFWHILLPPNIVPRSSCTILRLDTGKYCVFYLYNRTFDSVHRRGPAVLLDMSGDLFVVFTGFILFPQAPLLSMSDSLGLLSSSFAEILDLAVRYFLLLTPRFKSETCLFGRRDPAVAETETNYSLCFIFAPKLQGNVTGAAVENPNQESHV